MIRDAEIGPESSAYYLSSDMDCIVNVIKNFWESGFKFSGCIFLLRSFLCFQIPDPYRWPTLGVFIFHIAYIS